MSIRVGLNGRVADSELERIRSVEGVTIDDLTGLARRAGARGPEAAEDAKAADIELDARLWDLEALITWQPIRRLAARAPGLKWVQSFWAGVEALEPTGIFETGAVITTGRGVTSPAIAEWVIAAIYSLSKRFPNYDFNKTEKRWTRFAAAKVAGSTCCIVGLGAIGQAAAALATASGMRVLGMRRTPDGSHVPGVEHVYGPGELPGFLEQADFLVLAAPSTEHTRKLIDAAAISRLKPGAALINVARGDLVDETALADALRENRLLGAALDVFETEPLPAESPLWSLPNVIVSPHISASMPDFDTRLTDLLVENLTRYRDGDPLLNVYDRDRAY